MPLNRTKMRFDRRLSRCALHCHSSQARRISFLAFLFCTLLLNSALAQEVKPRPASNAPRPLKNLESSTQNAGVSFNPSNRRDPFLNPLQYSKKNAKQNEDEEESRGTPPPGIGGTLISQAALQGISIRRTGKLAVIRGADGRAYFLKEGDRLFDGYLKAIEDDSITLVRETRMKSGKLLTQDVIKRLRTQ
jgi:hypothetical protein